MNTIQSSPPPLSEDATCSLASRLRGSLLRPGDNGYEAARTVWNARVRRTPALVSCCEGVADVIRTLEFARGSGLPVSVRGGGHDFGGRGVCDSGLVIDTSRMKGIRVNPRSRTVIAQAGLTWGEFDHETLAFGLATTGGKVAATGVVGLTLGGGYGWLMRKHGLAVDNLLSADVVLADGRMLTADDQQNTDLFWALRGGGGNFGVVTSLEFRLHEVGPTLLGGLMVYPLSAATELLCAFRDFMPSAPDELMALVAFRAAPPARFIPPHLHGRTAALLMVCYAGAEAEGRRVIAQLRAVAPPIAERVGPMSYIAVQRLLDAAGATGFHVAVASDHLMGLPDTAIDTLVEHAGRIASPATVLMVLPLGGAVARVGEDATAYGHRRATFDYAAYSMWTNPAEADRHIEWATNLRRMMQPHATGVYVNQLGDEGPERVRSAYTPRGFARLAALKARYDPENVFRSNNNIPPAK